MKTNDNIIKLGAITANLQAPRTREEAMLEVDRELGVRIRCFPDWVENGNGKLSMGDARTRLESMAEAARILADVHALTAEQWDAVQSQAEFQRQQN